MASSSSSGFPEAATPREILARKVRVFFRHLPRALAGEQESIHHLRVAGRRLRMAIPISSRKPGGRRVRDAQRRLGDLIRTAGSCRDLDVGLDLLGQARGPVEGRFSERQGEIRALSRRLRASRALTRHRMTEALLDLDVAKLRRSLRDLIACADRDPIGGRIRVREATGELIPKIESLQNEMGGRYLPASQHTMRTRLRRLRYLLELEAELSGSGAPTANETSQLQALQSRLGLLHDAHVLAVWLLAQADREDPLASAARRLAEHFRRRSRVAHRAWLEAGPAECLNSARASLAGFPSATAPAPQQGQDLHPAVDHKGIR